MDFWEFLANTEPNTLAAWSCFAMVGATALIMVGAAIGWTMRGPQDQNVPR